MLENNDVPSEIDKNHISVGRVGSVNDYSYAFYNPHNARFYFNFMKWNFHPDMLLFKVINSKELMIEFLDCRIVVKKNLIEIVNKINKERRFVIDGSLDHRRDAVIKAVSILELESINVLKEFIKRFGGTSDCVCVRSHVPDNKILHDKIVDSIPDEVTFRNDVVKKVYKVMPKNVEVSTPEGASKTFRNLALFDFAPEIASRLDKVDSSQSSLNDRMISLGNERIEFDKALALYTEQINLHLKVEERQLDVQSKTLLVLDAIKDNLGSCKVLDPPLSLQNNGLDRGFSTPNKDSVSFPLPTISKFATTQEVKLSKVKYLKDRWGW